MLKVSLLPALQRIGLRRFTLLLILAASALPLPAVTRVTVLQLEQEVASFHARADKAAADHLAELELTQRLTKARCQQLNAALPGEKSRQALLALASASDFLDLPPEDILNLDKPDIPTQGKIVSRAASFVVATVSKMPDFFASRTVSRFQDIKVTYGMDEPVVVPNQGFHLIDKTISTVAFRYGREVVEPPGGKKTGSAITTSTGLTNWGVFGPLLGVVMADVLKGQIGWSHWEQGPSGPVAVFRYAVPGDRSNYTVRYCCFRAERGEMRQFEDIPAYHGELAIDPTTGYVYRLVVKTDLGRLSPSREPTWKSSTVPSKLAAKPTSAPWKAPPFPEQTTSSSTDTPSTSTKRGMRTTALWVPSPGTPRRRSACPK